MNRAPWRPRSPRRPCRRRAARGAKRGRAGLTASLERDLSGALRWRLADRSISRRKPGVATRRARDARENAAVRMDAAGATADAAAVDPRRVGAGNRAGRIASVARCGEGRRRTGARAGLTTRARTRADARGRRGRPRRVVVARCPIFGVAIALAALATLAIARSSASRTCAPAAYARKETRLRVGGPRRIAPRVRARSNSERTLRRSSSTNRLTGTRRGRAPARVVTSATRVDREGLGIPRPSTFRGAFAPPNCRTGTRMGRVSHDEILTTGPY